jgi:2-methylisocitrate lyase-like PEP mutase family enzyme
MSRSKPGPSLSRPTIRELLQTPEPLLVIGAHDGLSARIAQRAGFQALFHGSYAVAATHGVPDIGLVGLAETSASLARVADAVDVPVFADADTGYGNEPGVWRTVRELERAGASAVQIEDQVFPKRCGHMAGKAVIPRDEMIAKIRAACTARDPHTVIVARTDALQAHGLEEAIDRCNAYAEAGADIVFVDALESVEQMATTTSRIDAPVMVNMVETGRTPLLAADELDELGFAVVIFGATQIWTIAGIYDELCRAVLETGSSQPLRDRMMSFDEVNELLGLGEFRQLEEDSVKLEG